MDDALTLRLIRAAPRLREDFDPARHGGGAWVVSGRPAAWDDAARALEATGAQVVAYHAIHSRRRPRRYRGRPVIRGAIATRFPGARVVFAGKPTKSWFDPTPPGPQRCVWHTPPEAWQRGHDTPALWRERAAELGAVFAMLDDAASRRALAAIVRARLEGDAGYHRVAAYREYEHPVVAAARGDVVIDGGAHIGDIAVRFARRSGLRGRVYALEPSPENFRRLRRRARLHPTIVPVRVGVSREPGTLPFEDGRGGSSRVHGSGTSQIPVTSIDAFVRDRGLHRVDLIKLDVEGVEADALAGARETIARCRPKLAVSIYHHRADLWELPALLRPWLPGYRFYLGHHSHYHMETDLYAAPIERLRR